MRIRNFSLISVLIVSTLVSSCEKRDNGGKFTISGQWLKDCSGTAQANEPIDIAIEVTESIFSKPTLREHIGSGVTDDQGRFSIQCDNYGSGLIYINVDSRYAYSGRLYVLGGDGHHDDLGVFYDTYTATANLKFVFTKPLADTFFVSKDVSRALPEFYIYPASGSKVVQVNKTGTMKPLKSFNGFYGIGRADFNRPVSSGDPRILELPDAYGICGAGDTTEIIIP